MKEGRRRGEKRGKQRKMFTSIKKLKKNHATKVWVKFRINL